MSTPDSPAETVPVFRISLANALLVSGLYMGLGLFTELVMRVWNPRWLELFSQNLELFPQRFLYLLGIQQPLRQAYLDGEISTFVLRLIYGLTTVSMMLVIGVVIGLMMWLFQKGLAARKGGTDGGSDEGAA